jgi:hypothetical protein
MVTVADGTDLEYIYTPPSYGVEVAANKPLSTSA